MANSTQTESGNQAALTRAGLGFLRVAAVSPELRVADVPFNTAAISAALEEAAGQGVQLALFPELCITGYSCGDLFFQTQLHQAAQAGLATLAAATAQHAMTAVVGLPVPMDGRLYNCAALAGRRAHYRRRPQDLSAQLQRILRSALVPLGRRSAQRHADAGRPDGCALRR